MKDSNALPWSFDYNYGAQNPQFAQELLATLRAHDTAAGAPRTQLPQTTTHVYNILPNYWRGYGGSGTQETLCIGTAIIERCKADDNLWDYAVRYENKTSGEQLRLQFRCRDEHYRPLTDTWHIDARNRGDDEYSAVTSEGHLALDSEVRLRINGTDILAGRVDASTKLTCNWALFDVIPALAQMLQASGDAVDITLLEDLEQIRPKCRLGFLESIQTPLPLDGYYLYGVGLLPSYWWLDAEGNVAIASSTFETLVLKEKMGDRA